jgi:hypothetical protein
MGGRVDKMNEVDKVDKNVIAGAFSGLSDRIYGLSAQAVAGS